MTPKKSAKADLEGKRGFFFLIGIAVALTAAIITLQHESAVMNPKTDKEKPTVLIDEATIITVWKKDEPKVVKLKKVNQYLPPEMMPNDIILDILDPVDNQEDIPEEGPVEIERRDKDPEGVVPFEFWAIENIARPRECEREASKKAQKQCFDKWIRAFISQNTNYPELARTMGLEDQVFVTFIISETGEVEDVTIGRGEYDILNKEALRVLASMPQMTPGSQRGKNVKMRMTVPVNFRLSNR